VIRLAHHVSTKDPEFALRLEIFDMVRDRGRAYSREEIAGALGCSKQTIWSMERVALGKLARELMRREAVEGASFARHVARGKKKPTVWKGGDE